MNLKLILSTSAAALIAASAAQAQTLSGDANAEAMLSSPADPTRSSTGLPSVDSSRPTGADAGYTMMPGGKITGSTAVEGEPVNSREAMSGAMQGSAQTSATMNRDGMSAEGGMSAQTGMSGMQDGRMTTQAQSAGSMGAMASSTTSVQVTTNGPIPDTEENRARYGGPQSRAGKMTDPNGN
jgi:hypothetical protein